MGYAPLTRRQRPNHALITTLADPDSDMFLALISRLTAHTALTQQDLDACAPLDVQASALRAGAMEMLHTLHGPVFVRGMAAIPGLQNRSRVTTPDAALNYLYLRAIATALGQQGYRTAILTSSSMHAWNEDEHLMAVGTFNGIRTTTVNKILKRCLRWFISHRADLLICHPEGGRRVGALASRRNFRVMKVRRPPLGTSPHETLSDA